MECQQCTLVGSLQMAKRQGRGSCAAQCMSVVSRHPGESWETQMFLVSCQNELQAKDSPLGDDGNVSGKQTNVRLSQSVRTKTKTKQKSVK